MNNSEYVEACLLEINCLKSTKNLLIKEFNVLAKRYEIVLDDQVPSPIYTIQHIEEALNLIETMIRYKENTLNFFINAEKNCDPLTSNYIITIE
jgi:hypothetical protein